MEHFYQNIPGLFTFPQFYKYVAQRHTFFGGPWHGIELGTNEGQSVACLGVEMMNLEIPARIDMCDLNHDPRGNLGLISSVLGTYHRADSKWLATSYPDESLDLVFIDGDHSYDGTAGDIRAWSSKVKPGGILAGHDFMLRIPSVMQAVIDCLDEFNVMRCSRWDEHQRRMVDDEPREGNDYYPVWWKAMP